jgi:hypothetical protein
MPRVPALPRQMTRTYLEEKTIGSDSVTEDYLRESNKKRRREIREGFSRKRKAYAFRGDLALENDR